MSQVGRISGPLLFSNLERQGKNLSFRNDRQTEALLHLDVVNQQISVNSLSPTNDFDINGTARNFNLIVDQSTSLPEFNISDSTIEVLVGDINLDAQEAVVMANLENGTIRISDNRISSIESNADIDISLNGTGTVEIIDSNLKVDGNIFTPGNITFNGNITFGDQDIDTVSFNADLDSDIIPKNSNVQSIGSSEKRWNDFYTNLINGTSVSTTDIKVGLLNINLRQGGIVFVSTEGDDSNVGDHIQGPLATLKEALSRTDASSEQPFTILLMPGTYEEVLPLDVPRNVNILGTDIRNTIVKPEPGSIDKDVFLLNDSSTVSNITIKDYFYNETNNTGYAFRFAPGAINNTRSPYVQNLTVITKESAENAGDAGRGAWIDGSELDPLTLNASFLFYSATFILPNADAITMTNGVRVEWLNSFTYFANRGLYAFDGTTGRVSSDGSSIEYGAELRSIGSANVYGNYGAVADGADTLMYLIKHNFSYIGTGTDRSNDQTLVIEENQTLETNNGKIYFQSFDETGKFKVGDNFFIDQKNGSTSINIDTSTANALNGLVIGLGTNQTIITGNRVSTDGIRFSGNRLDSFVEDLILQSATDQFNFIGNSTVDGTVSIRDNFSFGGTLNLAGDQATDSLDFNVDFEQDFKPHLADTHTLGKIDKQWNFAYLDRAEISDVIIDDNFLTSSLSNSNLELRANGAGLVKILENNVKINKNLSIDQLSSFRNVSISGLTSHVGDKITDGDFNLDKTFTIDNVIIDDNYFFAVNDNLELKANANGIVRMDTSSVSISNNLTVTNLTKLEDQSTNFEFGPELVVNGTFDSNLNGWAEVGGGSASSDNEELFIEAIGAARNVSQQITVEPGKTYDFSITFVSAVEGPGTSDYIVRVFESGVGNLYSWTKIELDGENNKVLTGSFVPSSSTISIIFRCENSNARWDNVTVFEDIGLVTSFDPVDSNITGEIEQTGNKIQEGNISQIGNTTVDGNLTNNSIYQTTVIDIDKNKIKNTQEGLRIARATNSPYTIPQIVRDIIDGQTAADYTAQTDKNLVNFLIDNNLVDINKSGNLTTSDYLAYLQYISNGTTGNETLDNSVKEALAQIVEFEFENEGYFDERLFDGDYNNPDLEFKANGAGRVVFPTNDVIISNNLKLANLAASSINITDRVNFDKITINDIEINDNYISTIDGTNQDLSFKAFENNLVSVQTNDVIFQNELTVLDDTNLKNSDILGNLIQFNSRNQLGDFSIIGNLEVGSTNIDSRIQFDDIVFNDNFIETTQSNSNLELSASSTANIIFDDSVLVDNNLSLDILSSKNINIQNSFTFDEITVSSNINIFDNVISTTQSNSNLELRTVNDSVRLNEIFVRNTDISTESLDLEINANNNVDINSNSAIVLPTGSTQQRQFEDYGLRFNSTDQLFEGFNNSNTITFNGVYSDNRQTSLLAHPNNNSIDLSVNDVQVGSISDTKLSIHGLQIDDISINENIIETNISNSDLDLKATGQLLINNGLEINSNRLLNTSSDPLIFSNIRYGVVKFTGNSVRISSGDSSERPNSPEIGTTRWNTEENILETWEGNTFITAAGTSATISEAEMDDLILEYTLVFG